jgi:hypothetical protein
MESSIEPFELLDLEAGQHPYSQIFRFVDLPVEVRNKIYTLLLCRFYIQTNQDHKHGHDQAFEMVRSINNG